MVAMHFYLNLIIFQSFQKCFSVFVLANRVCKQALTYSSVFIRIMARKSPSAIQGSRP